ncbi:hypothetical protein VTH06DRAFT_3295 [Thermothelomyces fergusii]
MPCRDQARSSAAGHSCQPVRSTATAAKTEHPESSRPHTFSPRFLLRLPSPSSCSAMPLNREPWQPRHRGRAEKTLQ